MQGQVQKGFCVYVIRMEISNASAALRSYVLEGAINGRELSVDRGSGMWHGSGRLAVLECSCALYPEFQTEQLKRLDRYVLEMSPF